MFLCVLHVLEASRSNGSKSCIFFTKSCIFKKVYTFPQSRCEKELQFFCHPQSHAIDPEQSPKTSSCLQFIAGILEILFLVKTFHPRILGKCLNQISKEARAFAETSIWWGRRDRIHFTATGINHRCLINIILYRSHIIQGRMSSLWSPFLFYFMPAKTSILKRKIFKILEKINQISQYTFLNMSSEVGI